MTQSLEVDVLDDIKKSLSSRGLKMDDFEIVVIEELKSDGLIYAEGIRFRVLHKPSGNSAEYIEGHGHDIRDTLCKDISLGRFP